MNDVFFFDEYLGFPAASRLRMLMIVEAGWDGGVAKSLDRASLVTCKQMIKELPLLEKNVSVFMDTQGHLSIAWDRGHQLGLVEVFLHPGEVIVYADIDDEEVSFSGINSDAIAHIKKYI